MPLLETSRLDRTSKSLPLIAHVIHRLAIGGLENGLVNLINHIPEDRCRHVIIALTNATTFRERIRRSDVPVIELHKQDGHDLNVHRRFWQVLRQLRPAIVHTRNLSTIEFQFTAALAGVPGRIHGEHGRDMHDLDGLNRKYKLLRKALRPVITRYTAVSKDIASWLVGTIGVNQASVQQIYNGVDAQKFRPRIDPTERIGPGGFFDDHAFVIGTVGRMEPVKDQLNLVRAFIKLAGRVGEARNSLRLMMVGDGPLREAALQLLREAQIDKLAWLPGERDDVPALMRSLDLFVLPSLREGISNTILEAMASGLPVVATTVGGNPELVREGVTGTLVPHSDDGALTMAVESYLTDRQKLLSHGQAARRAVEKQFSMDAMVAGYLQVYENVLSRGLRSLPIDAGAIDRQGHMN